MIKAKGAIAAELESLKGKLEEIKAMGQTWNEEETKLYAVVNSHLAEIQKLASKSSPTSHEEPRETPKLDAKETTTEPEKGHFKKYWAWYSAGGAIGLIGLGIALWWKWGNKGSQTSSEGSESESEVKEETSPE